MNKLLTLAAVACIAVVPWQTTAAQTLDTTKTYYIQPAGSTNVYASTNQKTSGDNTYAFSGTPEAFVFEGNDTDGYTIKGETSNKYIGHQNFSHWNVNNAANKWGLTLIDEAEQTYRITRFGKSGNDQQLGWDTAAAGEGIFTNKATTCLWKFIDATEPLYTTTVNFKHNGNVVATQAYSGLLGATITVKIPFYTANEITLSSSVTEVDVDVEPVLPFQYSESGTAWADLTWQAVRFHTGTSVQSNKIWSYSDANTPVANVAYRESDINGYSDNELWAFIGDAANGFKIVNKAAGEGYFLTFNSTPAGQMMQNPEYDTWKIYPSTSNTDDTRYNCFKLKQGDSESLYMNAQEYQIRGWDSADEGSTIHYTSPAAPVLAYYTANSGTFANNDQVSAAVAAATAQPYDLTKVTELKSALTEVLATLNMPKAGKLYRFINVASGKYLSSTPNDNGRRIQVITDAAGNKLENIFYFDGEHLISVENGKVLGKFNANNGNDNSNWKLVLASDTDKAGTVTFSYAGENQYYITPAEGRYIYGANDLVDCGSGTNGAAPDGNGYKWTFTEVAWLPIPESQAGKNLVPYYSPVKLNIASNRIVHVLRPVINNGRVELQPASTDGNGNVVTDSYVPANTPVVIQMRSDIKRDDNTGLVYLEVNYSDLATDHSAAFSRVKEANKQYLALDAANRTYLPMAEGDILTGFRSYVELPEGTEVTEHRIRYTNVLSAGKVYAFKVADDDRGFIKAADDANQDLLWTSNKDGVATADAPYTTDANYQWTLVKDNNNNVYLYNLGRKQFASPYRFVESEIAEFCWHFTDEPADFDIEFFDDELYYDLTKAQIHIVAGENSKDTQRPGGMTVVNGNENGPVQCSNNSKEKNGNRFTFIELTDVELPADLPTADEIAAKQTEMAAAHGEIFDKVTNLLKNYENSELSEDAIGYYTQEATATYNETLLAADDATPEAKKYATLRGAKAAEGQVNMFQHEGVYNLKDANGDFIIATIERGSDGLGSNIVISTTGDGPDYSDEKDTYWQAYNWLATIDENGVLTFTHDFLIAKPKAETPASRAAAIDPDDYLEPVTKTLASGTPVYDGFGNISGLTAADQSYAAIAGASTADPDHNDATGISEIIAAPAANQAIYDLQGRRVNKASKGIYIVNGVKTLVK